MNKISSSINNKQFTVGIFIDLSKAFDTVYHNILLEKLEHCGIRGSAPKWSCSYLNDRNSLWNFMVTVQRHAKYNAECPRDLSLGPCFFLFILMICVMCQMSWILFCLQMTQIYFFP